MIQNKYQLIVNIKSKGYTGAIPSVTANDNIAFDILVYDGATPFDFTGVSRFTLVSMRKDNISVIREGTLVNGVIEFVLGSSETLENGRVDATVQLYDADNKRVSSAPLVYNVISDPSLNGSLPADDKTLVMANESLLTDAIDKANNADARISNIVAQAGTDNTEIVDSRQKSDGTTYTTLRDRLNASDTAVSGKANQIDLDLANTNLENVTTEIETARGTATNLGARLNSVDTQLAEKAELADLDTTNQTVVSLQNNKADKSAIGSPLVASTVAQMTDTTKIYVYTGSESGYTSGHWYFYNGSAWEDGGVYNSTAVGSKAVARTQLADFYSLGTDIASGTNLNTIVTEGTYTGLANGGYTNTPADLPTNKPFILQVFPSSLGGNRFMLQNIILTDNPNKQYIRQIDKTNTYSYPWNSNFFIKDGGITTNLLVDKGTTRGKLEDKFSLNADIASGTDLNTLLLEGNYTGAANLGCLNMPTGFTSAFVLKVIPTYKSGGSVNRFYIQKITKFDNPDVQYIRRLDTSNQYTTAWVNITNSPLSRLVGKKIVCFGDSITEFGTYPDVMASLLGATTVNVGFSSCRMGQYGTTGTGAIYDKFSMYNLARYINTGDYTELDQAVTDLIAANGDDNSAAVARLKATDFSTVDYITIFYGTNDYAGPTPMGTDKDMDGTTFKGAINYTIQQILSRYPNIKIAFISPLWRARFNLGDGLDSDTNPNSLGLYLIDYVDAIKSRANANHVPALDLYREGGINKYNYTNYLVDGLHPIVSSGYDYVGRKIAAFLQSKF